MNKPDLYNKANGLTKEAAVSCLKEYAPKIKWLKDGGRFIDLGCADGIVSSIMRKYVPSNYDTFVSCDINETMLEYARENYGDHNINFTMLDAEGELPNELKCNFNHAFSFFLFHWIRNQEKAFNNIFDLLTDGGDCLVTILKYIPMYEMFEIVARNPKWSSWLSDLSKFISPYYHVSAPEVQIKQMLENIGFINVNVTCKKMKYILENGREFKNLMRSVEPYDMPNDVFEEFQQDCVTVAQDLGLLNKNDTNFDDHTKPIDYNYTLLVIYATKP